MNEILADTFDSESAVPLKRGGGVIKWLTKKR